MSPQHKGVPCPNPTCGRLLDGSTQLTKHDGDHAPRPGDVSVCFYCGLELAYQEDLTVRRLTPEERARLPEDARRDLTRIRAAVLGQQRRN